MTQEYYFGDAKWIGTADRTIKSFSLIRGRFYTDGKGSVTLNAIGLGFFKCYINGVCINPDSFLPLSSEYEDSCEPIGEKLSSHRVYVPTFDISKYVKAGENLIAMYFGGGWYTARVRPFGFPKAIYRILVKDGDGERSYVSNESCKVSYAYVLDYNFTTHEIHDLRQHEDRFSPNYDDSKWENATAVEPLNTEYCSTDCPIDGVAEEIAPIAVGKSMGGVIYDCGKNIVGYPVMKINAAKGELVSVTFSEALLADGSLDPARMHKQSFTVTSDGNGRTDQPEFTWFGFRYFKVSGKGEPIKVKVVHTNISVTSSFECDNETLNWTYKTFIHTMLCNMHTGHPSDCPHIERRGYTGDGQLTCHAALSALGAKEFYEKWLQDIADGQDTISGHIQYTAPYIRSGGGPGGWGSAIVEVPYQLYRHYGDAEILRKYYGNMRRYIDYLEEHSRFGIVVSDKEGEWCLGDWCGPIVFYPEKDIISSHNQQMIIPAPMVNTYFYVRSLETMAKIAKIIDREEDIAEYKKKAENGKAVMEAAYLNTYDGNFVVNAQGANAYAVDIGIGNEKTYPNMIKYYKTLGHYDTGIFATDILTRVLFENGDGELAVDLLTAYGPQGFERWRRNGATTFHEYWDSNRSRSHNHPMFGAPVAYFFEYLLGIKQTENGAGYKALIIEPQATDRFGRMKGHITTPQGKVSVEYSRTEKGIDFKIIIPKNTQAEFKFSKNIYLLREGENYFSISYP